MPPDNAGFYHAAYVAAAAIYLCYAASVLWRAARIRRRLRELRSQRRGR